MSLTCPVCYFPKSEVTDSRLAQEPLITVRRRRECLNSECGHRWTTYEVNDATIHKVKAAFRAVKAIQDMDLHEIDIEL